MKMHHIILAGLYPLFRLKCKQDSMLYRHVPRLRVLLYHDIAPADIKNFTKQLQFISKRWTFLSPEEFSDIVEGNASLTSDSVLLTFDDGFKTNRMIAETVLDPLGIKGLFFVVPNFVTINNRADARDFIARNIFPSLSKDDLPDHWLNMTWDDIEVLIEGGHMIGSHALSHKRLSEIQNLESLEYEINQSAVIIEKHLGVKVAHFAYPFGDLASFSKEALLIAARRFKFVHSGLRGDNVFNGMERFIILRDSLNSKESSFLIGSYLEGCADFHYKKPRSLLAKWVEEVRLLL